MYLHAHVMRIGQIRPMIEGCVHGGAWKLYCWAELTLHVLHHLNQFIGQMVLVVLVNWAKP